MIGPAAPLMRLLGVRRGEAGRAAVLFLLSFVLGLSLVSFDLALSTSLVLTLSVQELAWTQVVLAGVVPFAGLAMAWLRPRLSTILFVTLPLAVVACVVLLLILLVPDGKFGTLTLLALWSAEHVLSAFAIVGFWTVAAHAFDVEQSRRIYGLINSGELLSGVLGGLSAGWLRGSLAEPTLLILALCGVLAGVLLTVPLARNVVQAEEAESVTAALSTVRGHGLVCLVYYAGYNILFDVVDFLVLVAVQRTYPGEPEAIAGVLGTVHAVRLSIGGLLGVFVSGRTMGRHGVGAGLIVPPIVIGGAAFLVGTVLTSQLSVLAAAILLKIIDGAVRLGLGKPAFMAAQRPMPAIARERTLLLIETAVEPATTGAAGAALLWMPTAILSGGALLLLPVPIAAAWLASAIALDRSYRRLLASGAATDQDP